MNTDLALPSLVFVPQPFHEDAVHPLACPACWHLTAVWLGKSVARCEVCGERFEVAPRIA